MKTRITNQLVGGALVLLLTLTSGCGGKAQTAPSVTQTVVQNNTAPEVSTGLLTPDQLLTSLQEGRSAAIAAGTLPPTNPVVVGLADGSTKRVYYSLSITPKQDLQGLSFTVFTDSSLFQTGAMIEVTLTSGKDSPVLLANKNLIDDKGNLLGINPVTFSGTLTAGTPITISVSLTGIAADTLVYVGNLSVGEYALLSTLPEEWKVHVIFH